MKALIIVGACALTLPYVISNEVYYLVGCGALNCRWVFWTLLLVAVIPPLSILVVAWMIHRLRRLNVKPGLLLAISAVSLALGFFCRPSGRAGDIQLCRGLADRVHVLGLEPRLQQYLQEVLARSSDQPTSAFETVPGQPPGWLKDALKESRYEIQYYKNEIRCLRLQTGGPFLRYGYYVGASPSDIPLTPSGSVSQAVNSNVVAFAE